MLATEALVEKFTDFSFFEEKTSMSRLQPDDVNAYACSIMTNGLFLMEFIDGIREGDGNRIIRCWRYMMMMFRASERKNYAIEASIMQVQYEFQFTPRMSMQLKWNRTVNIHGQPGKNISSDLHTEHLNRDAKMWMAGMGSNITEELVKRVACAMKPLRLATQAFDKEFEVPKESDRHTVRSNKSDLEKVLEQLLKESVSNNTR